MKIRKGLKHILISFNGLAIFYFKWKSTEMGEM